MNPSILVLIILLAPAFYVAISYNVLVRLKSEIETVWSKSLEAQLTKRRKLAEDLVHTLGSHTESEGELLSRVLESCNRATQATGLLEKTQAENKLTDHLTELLQLIERHPEIKERENVLDVYKELVSIETQLTLAQQNYNELVSELNSRIQRFPTKLFAQHLGLTSMEPLRVSRTAEI